MKPCVIVSSAYIADLRSQQNIIAKGEYGVVGRVPWQGGQAILKVMKDDNMLDFKRELFFLERLEGAGGAPRLLAVCYNQIALVISSRGHITLSEALLCNLPDWYLIFIVIRVGLRLRELHKRGVIHGDLHGDNIMVTLSPSVDYPPEVFLIDFGLSTLTEDAFSELEDPQMLEMLNGNGAYSNDVKYFGLILYNVNNTMKIKLDSIIKIILLTRPVKGEPKGLDEVLQKLYLVLTEDFKKKLPRFL